MQHIQDIQEPVFSQGGYKEGVQGGVPQLVDLKQNYPHTRNSVLSCIHLQNTINEQTSLQDIN